MSMCWVIWNKIKYLVLIKIWFENSWTKQGSTTTRGNNFHGCSFLYIVSGELQKIITTPTRFGKVMMVTFSILVILHWSDSPVANQRGWSVVYKQPTFVALMLSSIFLSIAIIKIGASSLNYSSHLVCVSSIQIHLLLRGIFVHCVQASKIISFNSICFSDLPFRNVVFLLNKLKTWPHIFF